MHLTLDLKKYLFCLFDIPSVKTYMLLGLNLLYLQKLSIYTTEALDLINTTIIHMAQPIGRSPGVKVVPLLIRHTDHINLKRSLDVLFPSIRAPTKSN